MIIRKLRSGCTESDYFSRLSSTDSVTPGSFPIAFVV
jgi:hypothetical protein